MSFARFSIDKRLVGALESFGYKEPSPIQEKVIPGALRGESMLVQAPTGSGKTHSFLIPIIARTDFDLPRPQAVIVAPSRELARQTYEFCRAFARAALESLRQQGALSGRLFYAAAAALEEDAPQAGEERP